MTSTPPIADVLNFCVVCKTLLGNRNTPSRSSTPGKNSSDTKLLETFSLCFAIDKEQFEKFSPTFCRKCSISLELWGGLHDELSKITKKLSEIQVKLEDRLLCSNVSAKDKPPQRVTRSRREENSPARHVPNPLAEMSGAVLEAERIRGVMLERLSTSQVKKEPVVTLAKNHGHEGAGNQKDHISMETVAQEIEPSELQFSQTPGTVNFGVQTSLVTYEVCGTQTFGIETVNNAVQTLCCNSNISTQTVSCSSNNSTQTTSCSSNNSTQTISCTSSSSTQTVSTSLSNSVQTDEVSRAHSVTQTNQVFHENLGVQSGCSFWGTCNIQTNTDDYQANCATQTNATADNFAQESKSIQTTGLTTATTTTQTECIALSDDNQFLPMDGHVSSTAASSVLRENTTELPIKRRRIEEVTPGKFLFKGRVPFEYTGDKYECGLCPQFQSDQAADMLEHIQEKHLHELKSVTSHIKPLVPVFGNNSGKKELAKVTENHGRKKEVAVCSGDQNAIKVSDVPTAAGPQSEVKCSDVILKRIKKIGLVKYIYRNKVPFDLIDGKFTCGLCSAQSCGDSMVAKRSILRHIRKIHQSTNLKLSLRNSSRDKLSLIRTADSGQNEFRKQVIKTTIKRVGPASFIYRDQVPFNYAGGKFICGSCPADDAAFWTKTMLLKHMRSIHIDTKKTTSQHGKLQKLRLSRKDSQSSESQAVEQNGNPCMDGIEDAPTESSGPTSAQEGVKETHVTVPIIRASPGLTSPDETCRRPNLAEDNVSLPPVQPPVLPNTSSLASQNEPASPEVIDLTADTDEPASSSLTTTTLAAESNKTDEVPFAKVDEPEEGDDYEEDELIAVGPGRYTYGKCAVVVLDERFICRECFQAFEGPFAVKELKTHVQLDHRELAPKINPEIEQLSTGKYVFRHKLLFFSKGKEFRCGACQCLLPRKKDMALHISRAHEDILNAKPWSKPELTPTSSGIRVTEKPPQSLSGRNQFTTEQDAGIQTPTPCDPVQDQSIDRVPVWISPPAGNCPAETSSQSDLDEILTPPMPTLEELNAAARSTKQCLLVKEAGYGQYIYCDRVPFSYQNGKFLCGLCSTVRSGKRAKQMFFVHLRDKHSDLCLQAEASIGVEARGLGKYIYRGRFPFEFSGRKFLCGLCSFCHVSKQDLLEHISSEHEASFTTNGAVTTSASTNHSSTANGAVTASISTNASPLPDGPHPGDVLEIDLVCEETAADEEASCPRYEPPPPLNPGSIITVENLAWNITACALCNFSGPFSQFVQHAKAAHGLALANHPQDQTLNQSSSFSKPMPALSYRGGQPQMPPQNIPCAPSHGNNLAAPMNPTVNSSSNVFNPSSLPVYPAQAGCCRSVRSSTETPQQSPISATSASSMGDPSFDSVSPLHFRGTVNTPVWCAAPNMMQPTGRPFPAQGQGHFYPGSSGSADKGGITRERITKQHHCRICRVDFTSSDAYEKHVRGHRRSLSYVCPMCNSSFPSPNDLRNHQRKIHGY